MKYILMFFLLVSMIFDIRSKKIPAVWIWCCILVMVGYRIFLLEIGGHTVKDFVYSILPGVLLYLFSRVSNGIGQGDGLLMIATGCFFTWKEHVGVLWMAFSLAAVFSAILLLRRRDSKHTKIPFIPFLFTASGLVLCL